MRLLGGGCWNVVVIGVQLLGGGCWSAVVIDALQNQHSHLHFTHRAPTQSLKLPAAQQA